MLPVLSDGFDNRQNVIGPKPMQLVVPIAVRNAVSAATITFTASSITLCFFIFRSLYSLSWREE